MKTSKVGIIGTGAAGIAAAMALHASEADVEVEVFARAGAQPSNRTLVNKGVAIVGCVNPAK
ncbi:hypothetical protein [Tomitella gaofuii]|uniref:hypothetical protein n=1 Tax=Tomitella gaofuii TaxID=2760083 RepID=UPI0015FBFF64|nr:hypothetical protein [Tomitella gaofuii]